MGDANAQIDFLDPPTPEIHLRLLAKKLLFYTATTLLFYGVFTIVFFIGIPVETIYESIGTSKKAEDRVETLNTYSGLAGAFVEVLVAMHVDKFMPVLDVYVHNTLYFLKTNRSIRDTTTGKAVQAGKISRRLHSAILFAFPIVLALTMGNSLRGLQAGQSSDGFKRTMSVDDLKKEQPTLDLFKAAAIKKNGNVTTLSGVKRPSSSETILKNAIREQSVPFTFYAKSPCASAATGNDTDEAKLNEIVKSASIKLNVHDLDSTSVTYGFVPQEWNGEAIPYGLSPTSSWSITYKEVQDARKANKTLPAPSDFSLSTAYEMIVQGKILIERAEGDAKTDTYPCWWTDNRTELDGLDDASSTGNSTAETTAKPTTTTKPAKAVKRSGASFLPKHVAVHVEKLVRQRRLASSDASTDDGSEDDYEDEPETPNQWTYDENEVRQCEGAVSSLFGMFDFDDPAYHTTENLVLDTAFIINKTLGNLSLDEMTIMLEKYDLTSQIHLEAIRIDIPVDANVTYGKMFVCPAGDCDPIYSYEELQQTFCGSNGCAFLDNSNTMMMQKQVGVVPYVVNCTLDAEHVQYSSDFRGFFPTDCKKVPNAALIYGIGSYITGDEYGSDATELGLSAPYITNARRHLRFTFAKVTWTTENLAERFNAKCGDGKQQTNCTGLWYQLQPSGRFLFAGDDALPMKKLQKADFRSPISLVQLNSPKLFVEEFSDSITLEPLTPSNFKKVKWDKTPGVNGSPASALRGAECSMLIDSYLGQVSNNNYALEQPLQTMYTAFFYYFMQNAAVTQLNDTKLALNGTTSLNQSTIALSKADSDRLGNVKLKGDKQRRNIRVSIPPSSFKTTLGGCFVIFFMTIVIVLVPARRVEHFEEGASPAQEFVAMGSDEAYPDSVHKKKLLFPATGEVVDFDELEIERMALVHETDKGRFVFL